MSDPAPADDGRPWRAVWRGDGPDLKAAADAIVAAGIEVRIAGDGRSLHGQARLLVAEADLVRARAAIPPRTNSGSGIKRLLRMLFPFGPARM